jgi:hypothetical protein
MNAGQTRAVALALEILQKTTEEFRPVTAWTDADWAIWRRANPLQDQIDKISRELAADKDKMIEYATSQRFLDDDTPFDMRKCAWAIIENAIHRRGFFRLWRSIIG